NAPDNGVEEATSLDLPQRKLLIARLLFVCIEVQNPTEFGQALPPDKLLYDSDPFKRYFRVVGFETGVEAINEDTRNVQASMAQLPDEMSNERNKFYGRHAGKIIALKERADRLDQLEQRRVNTINDGNIHKGLADWQIGRVTTHRDELKKSREETAAA